MKRLLVVLVVAGGGIAVGGVALAHHGTAASYVPDKEVTHTGVVSKFVWANPHSQLHWDVKIPDGSVVTWAGELHSIALLLRNGWRRDTIKVGDVVTVSGNPSRAGTPYMVVLEVVLDGKSYFRDLPEQDAAR